MSTVKIIALLVEDNLEDRATMRRFIDQDQQQTYALVEMSNGADAMRACEEIIPDVILLDYCLPDMAGRAFLEMIQRRPAEAAIPMVVLTGSGSQGLALEALRGGAIEYISKEGLTAEALRLALRAATEKGALRRQLATQQASLERANSLLREQQTSLQLALAAARMRTWMIDLQEPFDSPDGYLDRLLSVTLPGPVDNATERLEHIHPDDLSLVTNTLRGVLAGKTLYDLTFRLLGADRVVRWISTRGSLIEPSPGAPARLIGVSTDVSAQKRLEETVFKQQHAFQMVAENSPDIIARFDRQLRHTYVNPAATKATGLPLSSFIGRSNSELGLHATQLDVWDAALEKVFRTGQEGSIDFSYASPEGLLWYQAKLTPERDQSGAVLSVLSVARDITALRRAHDNLLRSERRARRLLESNIIGVAVARGAVIIEANDAFLAMVGATRDDLAQGRIDWGALTPPEYKAQREQALHELQTMGVCAPYEKECLRSDGRCVPVLVGDVVLEQEPLEWASFIVDLSSQKQADQERSRALTAFQTLAEHAPDIITRHDAATFRYLYANPAIEQAKGIPATHFPGRTYRELGMPEELCAMFDRTLSQVAQSGQPAQVTYEINGKHLRSMLVPEVDVEQHLNSILVVSHDITALQQEHQQTAEALRSLLKVAQVLVAPNESLRDGKQRLNSWQETARRLLDAMCAAFVCDGAVMVVHKTGAEVIDTLLFSGFNEQIEQDYVQRVRGEQLAQRFEDPAIIGELREGNIVALAVSEPPYQERQPLDNVERALLVPMRVGNTLIGIITLYLADRLRHFSADEGALALAMSSLVGLLVERERLFNESEEARSRAQAAVEVNRQMDAFLGIVSHELKTPLTVMKGYMDLAARHLQQLQEWVSPPGAMSLAEIVYDLQQAQRQLGAQNRLADDLVDVTRLRSDRLELQLELCDIAQIVREAVEDQRTFAPTRQIDLASATPGLLALCDAARIGQVTANYLTNALKYSEQRSSVEVRVDRVGSMARVAVRDHGPGIPTEQQQHIWERFYRVPGIVVKTGSGVGLGLGLHICKQLIERQGGQVGVTSVPGLGTTFWFTLPLVLQPLADLV